MEQKMDDEHTTGVIAFTRPLTALEGQTPAQIALAEAEVVPTAPPACEQRLFEFFQLVERHVDPDYSGRYGSLLQSIAEDQVYDGVTYLGLMRAPDGSDYMAYGTEGGLLRRMLREWKVWTMLKSGEPLPEAWDAHFDRTCLTDKDVTDENVLLAIIHEALPSAWAEFVEVPTRPNGRWFIHGEHETSKLMASAGKAMLLLQQERILVDMPHLHLMMPNNNRYPDLITPLAQVYLDTFLLSTLFPED